MKRGLRVIDGRVYVLAGRVTGVGARNIALDEARKKRAGGKRVRVIKLLAQDYLIYEF